MDISPEKHIHAKYPTLAAMAASAALAASLGSCTEVAMRPAGEDPTVESLRQELEWQRTPGAMYIPEQDTAGTYEGQGLIGTPCVGAPAKPDVTLEDADRWNREHQRTMGRQKRTTLQEGRE